MGRRKATRRAGSARKRLYVRGARVGAIIALATGLSFAYVWLHIQIVGYGYTLKKEEGRLKLYEERSDALKLKISRLKAPRRIEKVMGKDSRTFVVPDERRIVRINGQPRVRRFASVE